MLVTQHVPSLPTLPTHSYPWYVGDAGYNWLMRLGYDEMNIIDDFWCCIEYVLWDILCHSVHVLYICIEAGVIMKVITHIDRYLCSILAALPLQSV